MMSYRGSTPKNANASTFTLSPPTQPTLTQPSIPKATPAQLKLERILAQVWLSKDELSHVLGKSRATIDRSRLKKKQGDPAFASFPSDYFPSGPNSHVKFRPEEVLTWIAMSKK
jgi:hypothetical protein